MAPPANDAYANATLISGASGSIVGTLVDATTEGSDPDPFSSRTVWYKWVATSTGTLRLKVIADSEADWEQRTVGVYQGATIGVATKVSFSEAILIGSFDTVSGAYDDLLVGQLDVAVTSGQTYYIEIGDDGNADGNGAFTLEWEQFAASLWDGKWNTVMNPPTQSGSVLPAGAKSVADVWSEFGGASITDTPLVEGWSNEPAAPGYQDFAGVVTSLGLLYTLPDTPSNPSATTDYDTASSAIAPPDGGFTFEVGFKTDGLLWKSSTEDALNGGHVEYRLRNNAHSEWSFGFNLAAQNRSPSVYIELPDTLGNVGGWYLADDRYYRLKFEYVPNVIPPWDSVGWGRWRCYLSADASATWQPIAQYWFTPDSTFKWTQPFGYEYGINVFNRNSDDSSWSALLEGWGGSEPKPIEYQRLYAFALDIADDGIEAVSGIRTTIGDT